MPAAAKEETLPSPMVRNGEKIFFLAAGVAVAALETHQGANAARGKKPHQGIFSKNRRLRVGAVWAKWSGTHQDRKCSWSKTVSGSALDANGNTTTDSSGKSYTWDFENRLASAVVPGTGTVAFKYNPFGRRIYKSSPNFAGIFVYDGFNLIETVNPSGAKMSSYTQTQSIDEPLAELRGSTSDYYEADGLGSVTSLSSSRGTLANTYTYGSFGNLINLTGTLRNPFQYTAREADSETGLYYYRARYYDLNAGRFVSEDPGRFPAGINFYTYVENDPVGFVDPFGFCPWQVQSRPLRGLPLFPHYYFYNTQTGQSIGLGPADGFTWNTALGNPVDGAWETNEKPGQDEGDVPDLVCNCVDNQAKHPGKPPKYCTYQGNRNMNPHPPCTNCMGWAMAVLQDCTNQAASSGH
jgi:RHS repeat-associated protein